MHPERPTMRPLHAIGVEVRTAQPEGTSTLAKTPDLIVPEAVRPPEGDPVPQSVEIQIVDIAKLEAENRERQRSDRRQYLCRYYLQTKEAALAGDAEALQRWARRQEQNREANRRWRQNHPEKHRAQQREFKRRKKLRGETETAKTEPGY